jgi:hypothetical protein
MDVPMTPYEMTTQEDEDLFYVDLRQKLESGEHVQCQESNIQTLMHYVAGTVTPRGHVWKALDGRMLMVQYSTVFGIRDPIISAWAISQPTDDRSSYQKTQDILNEATRKAVAT